MAKFIFPEGVLNDIKKIVGYDKESGYRSKTAKIVNEKKQLSVRIPKSFQEELNINTDKDTFEWSIVPNGDSLELQGRLIRGNGK